MAMSPYMKIRNNLAQQGKYAEVRGGAPDERKETEIKIKVCGQEDPKVAVSYQDFAVLYQKQGNTDTTKMVTKTYHIIL